VTRGRLAWRVWRPGGFDDSELVMQDSEFGQAPQGTRLPHLLYVGTIARFTLSGSRLGGGAQGHLVKSRARMRELRNNRPVDGPGGQAAYELELPNGGMVAVVGNVIRQSAGSSNSVLVSHGVEGYGAWPHGVVFSDNTLVNEVGPFACSNESAPPFPHCHRPSSGWPRSCWPTRAALPPCR